MVLSPMPTFEQLGSELEIQQTDDRNVIHHHSCSKNVTTFFSVGNNSIRQLLSPKLYTNNEN